MINMKGIKFRVHAPSALLGGGLGLIAGSVLGYVLAKRALAASSDARLDTEIEAVRDYYERKYQSQTSQRKTWKNVISETLAAPVDRSIPVISALEGLGGGGDDHPEDEGEGILVISGDDIQPPLRRDPSKPYAIFVAELDDKGPEDGWQQITITWYEGDNVLVDDKEDPITNVLQTVGPLSIEGFGEMSGDPNLRYVRNEKLEVDFEIVLDRRSYVDVVLGYGDPARKRAIEAAKHR